jgi:hypothetical protein
LTDRVIQLRVCDIQNKWARMKWFKVLYHQLR